MEESWSKTNPFYQATYDRFRVIELIFERERKCAGLTHEQLAQRCNTPYVKPYHLTTMQNLTRTIGDPRHQMDRGRLLMALTWGLSFHAGKLTFCLRCLMANHLLTRSFIGTSYRMWSPPCPTC